MAGEAQHASGSDTNTPTNKRKFDDPQAPPTRRPTGFSASIMSLPSDPGRTPPSDNSVPAPVDEIQLARRRAQEIAARIFNSADPKRPRVENGGGFVSGSTFVPSAAQSSYGFQGTSKKINIPNGRVGVIIGKSGDTIKYLQLQSGARIQVTRDMDADPSSTTRLVELMGTSEQISRAEQLINDVLIEADTGGPGTVVRRVGGQSGAEQFSMRIPNNKVGLVIGKGGETIKSLQSRTGARIQVIPLHLPPGDPSTERTLQIDGSSEQIESAKQLVDEVISDNRLRNSAMTGGYTQQSYQTRPSMNWSNPAPPPGYGYLQPGAYPVPSPQYNMTQANYPNYPQQQSSGYPSAGWDQAAVPPCQQTNAGAGYDYYGQQQQSPAVSAATSADNSGYNYNQLLASSYSQGQGYPPECYAGGYLVPSSQPGYVLQQSYNSASGYGNIMNPIQDGQAASYGPPGENLQTAPPNQHGYSTSQQPPSPNSSSYPSQGHGMPSPNQVPAQPSYGSGYEQPQTQKPNVGQPSNGQAQQSPGGAQGAYVQFPPSQLPHAQASYGQTDSSIPQPSGFGTAAMQSGYGVPLYGGPPGSLPYNGNSAFAAGGPQPPVYSASTDAVAGSAQPAAPQSGAVKASPQS